MADRDTATGNLGLVQAFVNSVDLEDGPEELSDLNQLKGWLVAHGLLAESATVGDGDLKHAIALREAMRGVIGANTGHPIYPVDVATLNHAAAASGLHLRFGPDAKPRLEPGSAGVDGAMGRLVGTLYAAMEDEDWPRLKLCGSQACRWAFLDRSKNHSSRWCTMASCGNREKARRFRSRIARGLA